MIILGCHGERSNLGKETTSSAKRPSRSDREQIFRCG